MRRFAAALLSCCFVLQSGAGALGRSTSADTISASDATVRSHQGIIASMAAPFAGRRRQPPPGRAVVTPAPAPPVHAHIARAPIVRSGVALPGPHMLARPVPLNAHPSDPRAMRHGMHAAPIRKLPSQAVPMQRGLSSTLLSPSLATGVVQHIATSGMHTMSVPSVQAFQYEADTSAGASSPIFYTDSGMESGALSRAMDSAPTSAAASETLSYTVPNTTVSFGWISPANVPNLTSWPAQTYTVSLNITQPNANIKVTAVHILRLDSSGDGGGGDEGLAIVGETTGLSQALATAGTYTFTVSGAAQTASATDRLGVKIIVESTASGTQSFSYLAGQNSGSGVNVVQSYSLEAAGTAGPSTPIFYTNGSVETGNISELVNQTPQVAPTPETITYGASSGAVSFGWVSPTNVPNSTAWPAQSYTVTLNVTQANPNITITAVRILRVDSAGDGGGGDEGLATVAALNTLSQPLSSTGVLRFTLSGTAQTASATDRIAVKIVANNSAASTQSFSYLAGINSGSGINLPNIGALSQTGTGIEPWWTYVTGELPGAGGYAMNVSNGNLLIKSTDFDVPERGVDLAFQRTYNSQSSHDANNTDGSVPSAFGDGWTSSLDAHLAYDGANTISVYDIDGTRFDYTADGNGNWTPPTGQYATLKWDQSCGYQWFKSDGSVYYFYSPDLNDTTNCDLATVGAFPQNAAYGGRLYAIWGRNYNNKITLTYSWANSNASSPNNLTGITVAHSDGDSMTLTFGTSGSAQELATLTRPDGKVLSYRYNGTTLTEVDLPGTNGPGANGTGTVAETYQYASGHLLNTVFSPLYNKSGGTAGDKTIFSYDSSTRVTQISDSGVVNFAPSDNSDGSALQSGATGFQTWTTTNFSWSAGETDLSDMYGHYTNWLFDTLGRVTQAQRFSFTPSGSQVWLKTQQYWDSANNLVGVVDPRGMTGASPDTTYETDYAYDTAGNLVAAAQPAVTLNNGTYRPTYRFTYDANHNVKSACDPVKSHSALLDWSGAGQPANPTPQPSPIACPMGSGAAVYVWAAPTPPAGVASPAPYGELTQMTTPNGYVTNIAYTQSSGVDIGQPVSVTGTSISQTGDTLTPNRTPTQTFTYDGEGDTLTTNSGNGATTFAYDNMHRPITVTDPDNVAQHACYNDNGTLFYRETASQHAADGLPAPCVTPLPPSASAPANSVYYTYDADSNATAEVHHYGNISGTTNRWYDAGDRLVEVQMPLDSTLFPNTTIPHDLYPKPWMARYLYDNTGLMLWSDASGNGVYGDGHLYKVQQFVPSTPVFATNTPPPTQAWLDVRGWAWDPLDVPVHVYEFADGTNPRLSYTYNGSNSTMGLMYQAFYGQGPSSTNIAMTPSYLSTGWVNQVSYSNDGGVTPVKSYTFDADGRPTVLNSSTFGNETRSYDNDGDLTGVIEPTAYGGYGNIAYAYYGDDTRHTMTVTSSALASGASRSFSYYYRTDGLPEVFQPSWTGTANFSFTYTNAGRPLTESDPYTGQTIALHNQYGGTPTSGPTSLQLQKKQIAYDTTNYGRVASVILPEGYTYNQFTYDGEDEPTGYQLSQGLCTTLNGYGDQTCAASTKSVTYSARGEILATSDSANMQSADGFLCTPSSGGCKESFDARNGVIYSTSAGLTYGYDAFGRNTGVTMNGKTITRGYDADSHVTAQQNLTGSNITCVSGVTLGCDSNTSAVDAGSSAAYTWATNGHPVKYVNNLTGSSATTNWEHWDPTSDSVLFESSSSLPAALAVGKLGISNATNGVTVEDRDIFGQYAASHTGNQFTAWAMEPKFSERDWGGDLEKTWYSGAIGSNYTGVDSEWSSRILGAPRLDAYVDDTYGISFQGTRTADVNTGQWMTPDWFGGYGGDVISQQPYMWNNNNGLLYLDPSGYITNHGPGLGWHFPNEGIGGLVIIFDVAADLFIISDRNGARDRILCPRNNKDVNSITVSLGDGIIGSGTFTVDRYGNGYVSGGLAGGLSFPEVGLQISEGSVLGAPSSGAPPETIGGIMTKGSGNITAVPFYGRSLWTNASGTIVNHSIGTPELSLGASYGVPIGKVAHCK